MRAALLAIALTVTASPLWADARITVLMDVLKVADLVAVFREEGLAHAAELDADMLSGRGGAFWQAQVSRIYSADPILEHVRAALEAGLDDAQVEAIISHFATDTGQRIVDLEIAARRAIGDPEIEAEAKDLYAQAAATGDPLAALVPEFAAVNDLVERNVSTAMSASLRFYTGLADGHYTDQTEAEIIEQAWLQQDSLRVDTVDWLDAFFYMAYRRLPADVVRDHLAFCASDAGQALNAALFDGFGTVYREIAYALGRAIAISVEGDEI